MFSLGCLHFIQSDIQYRLLPHFCGFSKPTEFLFPYHWVLNVRHLLYDELCILMQQYLCWLYTCLPWKYSIQALPLFMHHIDTCSLIEMSPKCQQSIVVFAVRRNLIATQHIEMYNVSDHQVLLLPNENWISNSYKMNMKWWSYHANVLIKEWKMSVHDVLSSLTKQWTSLIYVDSYI